MKISLFPAILGATFLTYASASPLSVIVISTQKDVVSPIRFGHAAANVVHVTPPTSAVGQGNRRKHCGGKIHDKAIEISNMFRHALGLSLIEKQPKPIVHDGPIHILPVYGGDRNSGHHSHHHTHHRVHDRSFLKRIHRALMALKPWEGRAVAFVLGCGIGVLLRMVWVMFIVTYRLVKGERDDDHEYVAIITETSAEDILVPPPHYTIEKADHVEVVDHA